VNEVAAALSATLPFVARHFTGGPIALNNG
jgi:hypothetical protein